MSKKKKKDKTINELKEVLKRENRFYSKLNIMRFSVRSGVFIGITVLIFFFDIINLDEMLLVFLGLTLLEYLRYRKNKNKVI